MINLLDVADRIDRAETALGAFDVLAGVAGTHGYGHSACMEIPKTNKLHPEALAIVKMPEDWVEHYVTQEFALIDPVFRRAASDVLPFTWAEASVHSTTAQRRIMNEATSFGLRSGLTIPIHGPAGYCAEVTFAGGKVDDDPRVLMSLRFLATVAHDRARLLVRRGWVEDLPSLTKRERDCLHWVAAGKSDWAIAQILNISETTVHWHVEGAKRKFGASTRIQAIVAAIRLGLLYP